MLKFLTLNDYQVNFPIITADQERWISHLRDDDHVVIKPYDPTSEQKFEAVRAKILATLGSEVEVKHRGATGLKISGQDEIDIYIPVPPDKFDSLIAPLSNLFGPPRSHYHLERARFVTIQDGKHVDVFLINQTCRGWLDGEKFETYLRSHPEGLEEYRKLKEEGDGLSTRQYYRKKVEFINEILGKTR